MLLQGGGEAVFSVLAQGVVIEIGLGRLQGRFNGRQARIGNGRGRQTRVLVQVIPGIRLLVGVGDGALMLRQRIQQGGVDLQQAVGAALVAGTIQTVIDDRGDLGLVRAVGLLFDQGSDGDDLFQAVPPGLRLGQQIIVQLAVEVLDEPVQGIGGFFIQVEIIGVREQIALQTADILRVIVYPSGMVMRTVSEFRLPEALCIPMMSAR